MKSLEFDTLKFGFVKSRQKMQDTANLIRHQGGKIISVCFIYSSWWLFFESNVAEPIIKSNKHKSHS